MHAKVKHGDGCDEPPIEYNISGWILGLFFWNSDSGKTEQLCEGLCTWHAPGGIVLDGVHYGEELQETIPMGDARVSISSPRDDGSPESEQWKGWLLAGGIGKRIVNGAPGGYHLRAVVS